MDPTNISKVRLSDLVSLKTSKFCYYASWSHKKKVKENNLYDAIDGIRDVWPNFVAEIILGSL